MRIFTLSGGGSCQAAPVSGGARGQQVVRRRRPLWQGRRDRRSGLLGQRRGEAGPVVAEIPSLTIIERSKQMKKLAFALIGAATLSACAGPTTTTVSTPSGSTETVTSGDTTTVVTPGPGGTQVTTVPQP